MPDENKDFPLIQSENFGLKELRKERIQKEKREIEAAAKLYLAAKHDNKTFDPAEFGFVFSTAEIEQHLEGVRAASVAREAMKAQLRAA